MNLAMYIVPITVITIQGNVDVTALEDPPNVWDSQGLSEINCRGVHHMAMEVQVTVGRQHRFHP